MRNLIDRVWEYSQKNPEGFTFNLENESEVIIGIVVAYKDTQNHFGKESLKRVISHALEHGNVVGGWLNEDNNQYYFDSVRVFKNSELEKALEFGKANDQIAIFDLTNLKEIRIGG